ncbi:hypothetical protein L3X38_001594 [Prunus dulcis]|uniref:Protein FAR1-RELATED SEQUENCE n=1 Tax=Prunus dulcis TaxID=3755 RepID=A0AAD4WUW1_PRUDU|nr:hypothetical protein L3X38_001594 [Prunus dulcis]
MEDPTNMKDKVKDPEVGAIFDSLEELAEYYKNYGKEKGFEVSKRTSRKGDDGELKYLTLACSRSGKSKCNSRNSLKLHPITKTDCQARVRASICLDGKWKVCSFVLEHNHELSTPSQSPVFNDVLRGEPPNITYEINNTIYQTGYYLADGIYPRWTTFVKTIPHPRSHKQNFFARYQEGYIKDVERCFGILQVRWAIIRGAARQFDEDVLRSIMMTCIILHNMIVEDEYDYDADGVYEPNPMDTALTQIYEKPVGPNGEAVQYEPLVRDGSFMPRMIDRYTEMQSSYIHEHRQVDLMEHLCAVKGNEGNEGE